MSLLLSKLRRPRLAPALLERPELLTTLDRVLTCPLTLISAPAGFGKTTALLQWLKKWHDHAGFPPVAWVSLDEGDNDPLRFWNYILAACQPLLPQTVLLSLQQNAQEVAPFGPSALHQGVNDFVNELIKHDCRGILVLEEYHVIHEQQIHQTLTFLIEQLPPELHLVLMTRSDPPFSLSRLRANHQLLEIREEQLAFSQEEMYHFLQQTLSYEFTAAEFEQLAEQLEGWIAGLRLFTLGFSGRPTPEKMQHMLSSLTGRHRYFLDYFLTEVLHTQSEDVQAFLLQTCHLHRLCAALCISVTGNEESEKLLATIERAGLFLQPIEDSQGWYRYHGLFAEAMQHEATRRLGEQQIALCLERAQQWYEQNDLIEEAIEIALQRRAFAEALPLLERLLESQETLYQRTYGLLRWLQPIPETLLATAPILCLAYASALTVTFPSDQLDAATLTRVRTLLQYASEGWHGQKTRLAEVNALQAMIDIRHGNLTKAVQAARQALPFLPAHMSSSRVICQTVLAMEARSQGRFQDAYQALLSGLAIYKDIQEHDGALVITLFLGELCLEQGTLQRADAFFQAALQMAREDSNDQARALLGSARIAYERNNLTEAQQQVERALHINQYLDDRSIQAQSVLLQARIAAAQGRLHEAMQLLQTQSVYPNPPLLSYELLLWQKRFELAQGDVATVRRWFESLQDEELPAHTLQEQVALLRARWHLHNGAAQDALSLLRPWQEEALLNERLYSALQVKLLLSVAYHQLKQQQEARSLISECVQLAHVERLARLFLDEGETVATLLAAQLTTRQEKAHRDYIRELLLAFDYRQKPQVSATADPASLLATLSPQERQILRLLADGMERQEIAEHLVISLNTVKTHLQRLYQKLHVANRFEAVEVARQLFD
uniref:Helix-turn-helix transcriptional regulator n=1 Tax=Thermosporothrix sp. COM3 TaxID=2490863 RepID=A0A455SQC9_9CHLR|nr:helix-turn-helix transcriptional regulator [Thermosporothrix sp. COM3]